MHAWSLRTYDDAVKISCQDSFIYEWKGIIMNFNQFWVKSSHWAVRLSHISSDHTLCKGKQMFGIRKLQGLLLTNGKRQKLTVKLKSTIESHCLTLTEKWLAFYHLLRQTGWAIQVQRIQRIPNNIQSNTFRCTLSYCWHWNLATGTHKYTNFNSFSPSYHHLGPTA